jgi:tetratricopeptide (TPR) repeat protein
MKQANRLMKYPNSLILLASILWLGCDSLEDKKGRFLLKGNEKMEENDPKSAIGFYQEAIGLDSTYADAYYNKAMAHLRLNQLEETIADLTKAIQFRPDYVEAIFQRGLSYLDNGEFYTN